MMDELTLTVTTHDLAESMARLQAVGEIDRDSRDLLHDAAAKALTRGRNRLIMDLSEVTFCDSSGLSVFVQVHRETTAQGGWLRLAAVQPMVLTTLQVTNLDRLIEMHPTVEDATIG
jgi:anti-anti-sigma factor